MARIRSVKPDFFTHPHIVACSIPARLLLEALWTQADDAGRLRDQPLIIRALSFGEDDDVDVRALLDELEAKGRIYRYTVDGQRYIACHGFRDHQKPQKPTPSKLPAPEPNATGAIPEADESTPVPLRAGVGVGEGGDVGEAGPPSSPELPDGKRRQTTVDQRTVDQFAREILGAYPPSRVGEQSEALAAYARLSQDERDQAGRNLAGWVRHASWQAEQVRFVKGLTRWLTDGSWKEPPPPAARTAPSATPTPRELAKLKARRVAGAHGLTPEQEAWLARDVSILDVEHLEDLADAAREAVPFVPAAAADLEDPEIAGTLARLRRTLPGAEVTA